MNQIIIGLSLLILLIGASYKVMTKKDETLDEDKKKDTKLNTSKRVINDHIAEIMNVKKDK